VVVAVELSRLLRRGLLVAAIAATGWLLGVVFAGPASADELPRDQAQTREQSSGGLLGGLLGGITHTVSGLTDTVVDLTGSVVDTTRTLLPPVTPPAQEPIVDVPELLPVDDWTGASGTDRVDPAPAPAPVPAAQPAAPAPKPVVNTPVQAVAPAPVPSAAPAPQQAATQEKKTTSASHHAGTGSSPEPAKTPAGPSTPGSTASAAHNDSGGARGTHGVLVSHATLTHPADAGFTTRSRAVNAAGRDAGLPVATPD
jgi:outer membrane biosynthesis protein TonB